MHGRVREVDLLENIHANFYAGILHKVASLMLQNIFVPLLLLKSFSNHVHF